MAVAENSLIDETSPYLLQHAGNPVAWHPWGRTALERAAAEDKPIFLSIGYSSCHWCHVMAHESFESEDVAGVMNENFVSIKVDREERPDIDDIYQRVCQSATGQGGWPLSVFLTPDQKPFYVGTYFPAIDSYGRPGFGSICRQLAQAWNENRDDVKKAAENFVSSLKKTDDPRKTELGRDILDEAATGLLQLGDHVYGGFGSAPKFPGSANISFMFQYSKMSGISRFADFGLRTLDKMARGGIFDQIGGGFHRYSTDARWLVPHFEKMLYDNALIPINYVEAYQITKDRFYLEVLKKTLDFVLREMASPEGGFYSAYDADSEGVEGQYYTWTKGEIREILGDDADVFCLFHDVTDGGNWEGRNILCNNLSVSSVAFKFGMTEDQVRDVIRSASSRLLDVRSRRVAPGLDDKILVSWNSLMVTALARGYRVTQDPRYLDAARDCIAFIRGRMLDGERLMRVYKGGVVKIDGYLDDYSYFASALLDVFEMDPDPEYLDLAMRLGRHLINHFWDPDAACFYMTSDRHEELVIRPKSMHDLSLPSGNSVSAHLLLRLFHMSHEQEFLDVATRAMESSGQEAAGNPFAFGYMLNTISMYTQKISEITIINTENREICGSIFGRYAPNSLLAAVNDEARLQSLARYPFFSGKSFGEETRVFICRDFACSLPLGSMSEIEPLL